MGEARRVMARFGRRGIAWWGELRLGEVWSGMAGEACFGRARLGKFWFGKVWRGLINTNGITRRKNGCCMIGKRRIYIQYLLR